MGSFPVITYNDLKRQCQKMEENRSTVSLISKIPTEFHNKQNKCDKTLILGHKMSTRGELT